MQAKQNPQPSEVEGVSNCTKYSPTYSFPKGNLFRGSLERGGLYLCEVATPRRTIVR